MSEDVKLLNMIYQNAEMGLIGIDNIKSAIKDRKLKKVIKEQENDYYAICKEAVYLLSEVGFTKEEVSPMANLMTMMDAKMKTLMDNSTSNIAKMMMTGNNKGIIEIQEQINKYEGKNKKALKLAIQLLNIEKRNLNNLKKYL